MDSPDEMRASLREYVERFIRSAWTGIGFLFALVGLFDSLLDLDIPPWLWRGAAVVAVIVAGFRVFDDVRRQRDAARAELAITRSELTAGQGAPPEPPEFVPRLLEGRLLPSMSYPLVGSSERALVLRAGYAVHGDAATLHSNEQRAFDDAVAGSTLESWILDETTDIGRAGSQHGWRRSRPTSSSVVTVRRPPAQTVADDYAIEAQAVLNLHPDHGPWPAGWLLVLADVVVRPQANAGHAFTLSSFYGAAEALVRALVDEIAPAALAAVGLKNAPYSLTFLIFPQGVSLSDIVALDWQRWERAEDMGDVYGGQWFATARDVVASAGLRQDELRRWFGRVLADNGFYGHEDDVAKLAPLTLRPPPPT